MTDEYGKKIKRALIDIGKNQKWLVAEVRDRTGLYFDHSYLSKIMSGKYRNAGMVRAIDAILCFSENEKEDEKR